MNPILIPNNCLSLHNVGKKEFLKYLDKNSADRLRFQILTENGEVKDVVVQYEIQIDGKWIGIVRYDCAHGFFNRDVVHPNGENDKKVFEFDNLKVALSYA